MRYNRLMDNKFFAQEPNNNEIIKPEVLSGLVGEVQKYNSEHGKGTWMGKGLAALFMGKEGVNDLQKNIDQQKRAPEIIERHAESLKALGLSMESPNKEGDFDDNEKYAVGDLEFYLENNELYQKFLSSINEKEIKGYENELLLLVIEKFDKQISEMYQSESFDERLLEIFGNLDDILKQYERLGLDGQSVQRLAEYKAVLPTGYLKEYVMAKDNRFFEEIGTGFNLSTFQQDSSPEMYQQYWDKYAFLTLDAIKDKENAEELYKKMLDYLDEALNFSMESIKNSQEAASEKSPSEAWEYNYWKGLYPAAEAVKQKLEEYKK